MEAGIRISLFAGKSGASPGLTALCPRTGTLASWCLFAPFVVEKILVEPSAAKLRRRSSKQYHGLYEVSSCYGRLDAPLRSIILARAEPSHDGGAEARQACSRRYAERDDLQATRISKRHDEYEAPLGRVGRRYDQSAAFGQGARSWVDDIGVEHRAPRELQDLLQ